MWREIATLFGLLLVGWAFPQNEIKTPIHGNCHFELNQLTCDGYHADVLSLEEILKDQGITSLDKIDLKSIQLRHGQIRSLPRAAFVKMHSLSQIVIHNMSLNVIENGAFEGLHKLKYLDLSNNDINVIPTDLFRYTGLKSLRLEGNKALTIPTNGPLFDAPKLRWLSLRRCGIEHFPGVAFSKTPFLSHLDLSYNHLEQLPEVVFENLTLTELNLSNNNFKTLSLSIFQRIHDYPKSPKLVVLSNNYWHCDCQLAPLMVWLSQDRHTGQPTTDATNSRLKTETFCKTPSKLSGKSWNEIQEWSCNI